MPNITKSLLVFFVLISFSFQTKAQLKICSGKWLGELQINEYDVIPFDIEITKLKGNFTFTVLNGEERIELNSPVYKNDSAYIRFPYFNSELRLVASNRKTISGYWFNYNKGDNYKIPFEAKRTKDERFTEMELVKNTDQIADKWKVTFEPNTKFAYPAVGLFTQSNNQVTGTFLTETGDYRFLEGNVNNDSLFLSCFDGSHAFLFKAVINDNSLKGKFYSGNHWNSEWEATPDENFELSNPDEITTVNNDEKLSFSLKKLDGSLYNYPNSDVKGKVVIIQIMGSWCPNCLDETQYYKELYEKYKSDGLEIISVCYEISDDFDEQVASVLRLKEKLNLDFNFLIGGKASKVIAAEQFNVLSDISSFPTTLFIDRNGDIKRVHTGFNGPGTGQYYTDYVEKTNALIESMLMH